VPELGEALGLPVALGLGVVLVGWYVAGNQDDMDLLDGKQ